MRKHAQVCKLATGHINIIILYLIIYTILYSIAWQLCSCFLDGMDFNYWFIVFIFYSLP